MPIFTKDPPKNAIANNKTLDQIPDIRHVPELVEARQRLADLDGQLAACVRAIIAQEGVPDAPATAGDDDALRVLAGEALDPAGAARPSKLQQLRRQQAALERAIELARQESAEVERRLIAQACARVEPLVREYAAATIEAAERLAKAVQAQAELFTCLQGKGFRANCRPAHWKTFPSDSDLLRDARRIAERQREAFGLTK